ncbi:energy-coupling factor ABC transporter ATP-binding protein [Paenibacillus turpanensis]|uniref:energy-coupling factor ABC transporter ATP-binding protein n=1 Tax=Paenibacillus turpanensis TaxID=2689078 RepID=UPI00140CE87F|nr:ABC transporter ATP-binding protein [Paenibacillus turpanensis]
MEPIVTAENVSFAYPGTSQSALRNVTLRIPAGKRTALCGHNGSGKSTFFLQAAGLHQPSEGRMLWGDSPYSYRSAALRELRQRIGLVLQDPEHQLILNTPREDISYGLRNAGFSEQEIARRTAQSLAAMGLEALADTPLHHLSIGLKKRVALAGVLVLEPKLLLLDEPTAYLDRASERRLVDELNRAHDSGITVVMATHDMDLAYAWADWVIIMDGGRVVMEGEPTAIFRDRAALLALGLEQPLLMELWQSLPSEAAGEGAAPRTKEQFKRFLSERVR